MALHGTEPKVGYLLDSAVDLIASGNWQESLPWLSRLVRCSLSEEDRKELLNERAPARLAVYLPEAVVRWGGTTEDGSTDGVQENGSRCLATYDSMTRRSQSDLSALQQTGSAVRRARAQWMPKRLSNSQAEWDTLFMLLRIVRNLCAAGEEAGAQFIETDVPKIAGDLAEYAATYPEGTDPVCKLAMQVLCNLALTGHAGAAAVWSATFPSTLKKVAETRSGLLQSMVCRALICACLAVPDAGTQLTSTPSGHAILAILLDSCVTMQEGASMMDLAALVGHLAIAAGLLPELFACLASMGPCPCPRQREHTLHVPHLNDRHVAVLQLLAALVGEVQPSQLPLAPREGVVNPGVKTSVLYLLDVLDVLASPQPDVCTASQQPASQASEVLPVSESIQASGVEALLEVMREICARDAGGALAGDLDLADVLYKGGLVRRLLDLLRALPPIQSKRPSLPLSTEDVGSTAGGSGALNEQVSGAGSAVQPTTKVLYFGYRTDLVAVLANALHQRAEVQQEIQALGGIELLLNHCQIDPESPLLREWSLWAVRNLCYNNPGAQEAISALQMTGTLPSTALDQLGLKVTFDPRTHKMEVSRNAAPPSPGMSPARRSGLAESLLADDMIQEANDLEEPPLTMWHSEGMDGVQHPEGGQDASDPSTSGDVGGSVMGPGEELLNEEFEKELRALAQLKVAEL